MKRFAGSSMFVFLLALVASLQWQVGHAIVASKKHVGRKAELSVTTAATEEPVDCVLADWTEWGNCSQACSAGHKSRYRHVKEPAKNGGFCDEWDSEARLDLELDECQFGSCEYYTSITTHSVNCLSKVRAIYVIDRSSDVGRAGNGTTDYEKEMPGLVSKTMQAMGDNSQVSVLAVGGPKDQAGMEKCYALEPSSLDLEAACGISWGMQGVASAKVGESELQANLPEYGGWNALSKGLEVAELALPSLLDGEDVVPVIMVFAAGADRARTSQIASQLKQKVRIYWVAIGDGSIESFFQGIAAPPSDQNVLKGLWSNEEELQELSNDAVIQVCPVLQRYQEEVQARSAVSHRRRGAGHHKLSREMPDDRRRRRRASSR